MSAPISAFAKICSGLSPAGAGLSVFPCFAADSDPRLVRVHRHPIAELYQEQWLVSHHEDRHRPEVRRVVERITALMRDNAPLFRGEMKQAT